MRRAKKNYRRLHGKPAEKTIRASMPQPPKTAVLLGEVVEIVYKRPGEVVPYLHKFRRPKPLLVTDDRGRTLFFVSGGYRVTPRGIVG